MAEHFAENRPVQEMPVLTRLQADSKMKDDWEIPVVRLSEQRHPMDLVTTQYVAGKAEAGLREAGASKRGSGCPARA